MTQYDFMGNLYNQSNISIMWRNCVYIPTIKHVFPNLERKNIMDLACGNGFYTRLFKSMGAGRVLGVDISEAMILDAKTIEKNNPIDVQYQIANAATLNKTIEFDIVFAGYCLHYAQSKDELFMMCKNIANNLKSHGRFVAFNENPFKPIHIGNQCGGSIQAQGEIKDGVVMKITFHDMNCNNTVSFNRFHYSPKTYDLALKAAGFKNICWSSFVVDEKMTEQWPQQDDWQDIIDGNTSIAVLDCHL